VIDGFGHNGHHRTRRFGVIGTMGRTQQIREQLTQLLIACYCEEQSAALHVTVPLPTWPSAAANEPHYFGSTP
jgi:hypothetical protein